MRMADLDRTQSNAGMDVDLNAQAPLARGPLFYIGAGGLVTVMIIETVAVIGRHAGWPLLGAIEIIQAAILLAACSAMVSTTISHGHASVHLLTDRLPLRPRRWLLRFGSLLSALFFIGLTVGGAWLALDFWNAHEQSELLHIPIRPLRILAAVSVGTVAAIFLFRSLRSGSKQ
jgi:TRAP-type C4-dicarboxylate transport system permease small subunit